MEKLDVYNLKDNPKFVSSIQSEGFNHNIFTSSITYDGLKSPQIAEVREDYLIIPKDLGHEPQAKKDARQKLRNLADKFKP